MSAVRHVVHVRHKMEFLHRMMRELAGDSRISFEGNLSACRLRADIITGREDTGVLRRSTLHPVQDFVVLALTAEAAESIFKDVVMAAGLKHSILHVQIERRGVLELGAYDNFQHVVTGPGIGDTFLSNLKADGNVADFEVVKEVARS